MSDTPRDTLTDAEREALTAAVGKWTKSVGRRDAVIQRDIAPAVERILADRAASTDECDNEMCSLSLGHSGMHRPHGVPATTEQADDGLRERIKVSRDLPFSFRMPTNRADNADGQALNAGTRHIEVQVVHEPDLPVRGECRPGYGGTVIALREWDEQVFLHEMIHAATDYAQPHLNTTHPPHGHEVISRIEVALWESGWRFQPSASTVQADDGLRERIEALAHDETCPREWDEPGCLCWQRDVLAILDTSPAPTENHPHRRAAKDS